MNQIKGEVVLELALYEPKVLGWQTVSKDIQSLPWNPELGNYLVPGNCKGHFALYPWPDQLNKNHRESQKKGMIQNNGISSLFKLCIQF